MATDKQDEMYDSGQAQPAGQQGDTDLEQYGVWVKAGPEDVDEEPQQGEDDFELADLGDFDENVEESADLTDEEEDLLAGLEEAEGAETQDTPPPSAPTAATETSESVESDIEELDIDLDEEDESALSLSSGDELDLSLPEDSSDEESGSDEDLTLSEDTEREIGDLSKELSAEGSTEDDEDLDLDLDAIEIDGEPISMEAPEEPAESTSAESEPSTPSESESEAQGSAEAEELPSLEDELNEDLNIEEIDLEDEDLDVDLELDEDLDQDLEELSADLGGEEELPPSRRNNPNPKSRRTPGRIKKLWKSFPSTTCRLRSSEAPTEELETQEVEADEGEDSEIDLASIPSDSDLEEFSFDEEELEAEDSGEELPELDSDEEYFDDVSAVQGEMTEPVQEEPELSVGRDQGEDMTREEDTGQQSGASSEALTALAGIERELSAIKSELTDLRAELATLRAREPQQETDAGEAADAGAPAAAESAFEIDESEEKEEGLAGGFFADDEEEDETIALTGDELDHILDSAEFTEETGTPTELEDLYGDHSGEQEESSGESAGAEEPEPQEPIEELTLEEMGEEGEEGGAEDSAEPEELDALDLEELGQDESESESEALEDMELEFGGEPRGRSGRARRGAGSTAGNRWQR